MDWSGVDALVGRGRRAGRGRAGHRHLLPADARAGLPRRRRSAAHLGLAFSGQLLVAALVGGGAVGGLALSSAAASRVGPAGQRQPRRQPRHRRDACTSPPGTPTAPPRAATAARPGRRACAGRGTPRRASTSIRRRRRQLAGARRPRTLTPEPTDQPKEYLMEIVASSSLVIAAIFIVRTFKIVPQQHAWVVERLGKYDAHADAGPELRGALHRPRGLQAFAEGNPARRAEPGLHHHGQHPAAGRRHPVLPGHRPDARQLRLDATTSSPSPSWRRPRCAR